MSSWSKRRKMSIASVAIIVVAGLLILLIFKFFYRAPTCSDGIQNGGETGVDCGGGCERLCPSAFLAPIVDWTRFEQVAPGLYNVAAYIENPNIDAESKDVPYHIAIYDKEGMLITDRAGLVTIPPHRNTLAFDGAVSTGKRIPVKALFEFTGVPKWLKRIDPLSPIKVIDKNYNEDQNSSSLTVTFSNNAFQPIENLTVYAVLYDKDGNTLGFSKTIVDEIPARGRSIAPFTWPVDRGGKVVSIEILPVIQ